jgi:hypothetical protein
VAQAIISPLLKSIVPMNIWLWSILDAQKSFSLLKAMAAQQAIQKLCCRIYLFLVCHRVGVIALHRSHHWTDAEASKAYKTYPPCKRLTSRPWLPESARQQLDGSLKIT